MKEDPGRSMGELDAVGGNIVVRGTAGRCRGERTCDCSRCRVPELVSYQSILRRIPAHALSLGHVPSLGTGNRRKLLYEASHGAGKPTTFGTRDRAANVDRERGLPARPSWAFH